MEETGSPLSFQGRKKNIVLSQQPLSYLHFSVALLRVLLWRMMNHFLLLESVFFKIDMKEPQRKNYSKYQ